MIKCLPIESDRYKEQLAGLDQKSKAIAISKVELLAKGAWDLRAPLSVQLGGVKNKNLRRLKAGDYRIIYKFEGEYKDLAITVLTGIVLRSAGETYKETSTDFGEQAKLRSQKTRSQFMKLSENKKDAMVEDCEELCAH